MSLMDDAYFVFIESNTTGTGELFVKEAIRKGFKIIFLTKSPDKYSFLSELLIHPVILDTEEEEVIYSFLTQVKTIKAIFSSSEYFIEIASLVARRLGLMSNSSSSIKICRDKYKLYEKLNEADILVPETILVKNMKQALEAFTKLGKPVIIKPCSGSGSTGVKLCYNQSEVLEHINYLMTLLLPQNISPSFLVQQFIDGIEYSVETISKNGLHNIIGITKKFLGPLPYFIESGHDFPASCMEAESVNIKNCVKKALDAVTFEFGPSHTEVRIHNSKVYIIEINPRLAGGMIPQLVKAANNIDLIDQTMNLFLNKEISVTLPETGYASIRFFIAETEGVIKRLNLLDDSIVNDEKLYEYKFTKKEGSQIEIHHDFRDRVGYVIAHSRNSKECIEYAEYFLKKVWIQIENVSQDVSFNYVDTGVLKKTLHPNALTIINKNSSKNSKLEDFNYYVMIDEVHLLMLYDSNIINLKNVLCLLREIYALKAEKFACLVGEVAERGTYLLYERELIRKLGINIAGSMHAGRSRNDLHETIFRLSMREKFFEVYQTMWKLRSQILFFCDCTQNLAFPIYSQYQTALPGTFAHYLMGIDEALSRDQVGFQELYKFINTSPLGSGSGGGTSFPINTNLTSKLLGFDNVANNSLDAIASKDVALKFISSITILGTTLSRLAEDMQLWSTCEFNLISFPDNLLGGSSMMPQKKNPYLLEEIKAKISELGGFLVATINAVGNTPFGNSYKIKSVVQNCMNKASEHILDALDLMRLVLEGMKLIPENILKNLRDNVTVALLASETLTKNSYTAKEAHKIIGEIIHEARKIGNDPSTQVIKYLLDRGISIGESPLDWAESNEYGNGPGKLATKLLLDQAKERLLIDSYWYHNKIILLQDAENFKNQFIKERMEKGKC